MLRLNSNHTLSHLPISMLFDVEPGEIFENEKNIPGNQVLATKAASNLPSTNSNESKLHDAEPGEKCKAPSILEDMGGVAVEKKQTCFTPEMPIPKRTRPERATSTTSICRSRQQQNILRLLALQDKVQHSNDPTVSLSKLLHVGGSCFMTVPELADAIGLGRSTCLNYYIWGSCHFKDCRRKHVDFPPKNTTILPKLLAILEPCLDNFCHKTADRN
jgi:hypothetical protein